MKNKKLVTTIASVALVAIIGIGATLAYLTDNTDPVVNTFTVGDVKIDLVEPDWNPDDAQDMTPGSSVSKDPTVVNTGRNSGYMMLEVDGMAEMRAAGFEVKYDTATWDLVDETGAVLTTTGDLQDGYYVYKGGAVAAGGKTTPLFTSVKYLETATGSDLGTYTVVAKYLAYDGNYYTGDEMAAANENLDAGEQRYEPREAEDGKYILGYFVGDVMYDSYEAAEDAIQAAHGDEISYQFDLTLKAYAIQSDNIEFTPYTGWVSNALNGEPAQQP